MFVKTRQTLLVAILAMIFVSPLYAANSFLAVTSCPPWKHGDDLATNKKMVEMCQIDSAKMTDAITGSLPVDKANAHALLQTDATPHNLYAKLDELRATTQQGDTLYFFQMSHGGILPHTYKGYPVHGEVFAYYTKNAPKDFSKAVTEGKWLSARELRDELSMFASDTGANVVVIIEACHAESAAHELVHNPIEKLSDDEKIAYIFSAGAKQTSTFTDDQSGARFTEEFATALENAPTGTSLADVFSISRDKTHREALANCERIAASDDGAIYQSADQYFENCLQHPTSFDPKGLLLDLTVL
ncbi:caspase family protein [Halomonas aquatica]|uniref:Caspase family protein n=1 Tax=Halomonas aquatica TaxID=3151123 RepID=A0ABV1NG41_9GAMM